MTTETFPVDAVYLWVDGDDPAWRARRDETLRTLRGKDVSVREEGTAPSRFRDNDELRYSLRSLEKYAPWIHTVHLVTDHQTPEWLNPETVNLVDHTDILPQEAVYPIFNSNILELCMHRIPGLAEHFIEFNDDCFLGAPIQKSDFFTQDGKPLIWAVRMPSKKFRSFVEKTRHDTDYRTAVARTVRLAKERFGKLEPYELKHTPKGWSVSGLEELWRFFPEDVYATLKNPFRTEQDIMVLYGCMFLMRARKTGVFREIYGVRRFFDMLAGRIRFIGTSLGDPRFSRRLEQLRKRPSLTFCMNDSGKATPEDIEQYRLFLDEKFSSPSRFEMQPNRREQEGG